MRVVIDTNVFLSALLSPQGVPASIIAVIGGDAFGLYLSRALLDEIREVLQREKIRNRAKVEGQEIARLIKLLETQAKIVEPQADAAIQVPNDPDENVILKTAIAAEADYIISGDHHLLDMAEYRGVAIMTPRAFLAVVAADQNQE